MSTQPFDTAKHPRAGDGTFSEVHHPEGTVALAAPPPPCDPEQVAKGILNDLRDIPEGWTRDLFYGTVNAVRAGKTTYPKFLDELIAKNHGGRCALHEHDPDHSPERYCHDCHVAFMVEARTNPKPLPIPRGVVPVRQPDHDLIKKTIAYDSDDRSMFESSYLTGDEKFGAAVRRLFRAPDDAPVEVVMEHSDYWASHTEASSTEITVKCGDRKAIYSHMGSFMSALDRAEQDSLAMALRWSGDQPQLSGIAAVYLASGDADPEPVFGKIRDVFPGDDNDPSMDFLHLDGRQEYLELNQVVTILETDQST